MKSKTTVLWFMLAAALAAAIWVLNTYFQPAPAGEKPALAGLRAGAVTGIRVIPAGGREISVLRTNQTWQLDKPLVYPAQGAAVDGLLGALEKLAPTVVFSAGEMSSHKDADAEFGFDNPQFTIDLASGDREWHLRVGKNTATGDGVYVRIVGATGALVTGTAWLQFLPHDANSWRDTKLVDVPGMVDWLVITNGAQAIELRRDVTNHLWRLVRPLQARANNLLITSALGQLQAAAVSRFVTDDPKADLTGYGLDPASLDVWFGSGTNLLTAVHGGKEVSDLPGEVYARREGWSTVLSAPKEALAGWRGTVNDFRDPNLVDLTAPVAEIDLSGEYRYDLQFGANGWELADEKFPIDAVQVTNFIKTLANLRVAAFVKDSVTTADLQKYGLTNPVQQIVLRAVPGDTNHTIAQLLLGATATNQSQIYVKRGDEDYFVYATPLEDMNRVPISGDFFRARPVWSFSETNVAAVTVRENGKVRKMTRSGTNDWSLAAGSQGVIEPHAIEETVHRLGGLSVEAWIGRQFNNANLELTTNSPVITIELKSGEAHSLEIGREIQVQNQTTALAVVTFQDERWAFVFPRVLYGLVATYLTAPADVP
jgi:hypothetical protein